MSVVFFLFCEKRIFGDEEKKDFCELIGMDGVRLICELMVLVEEKDDRR